jgi:hypothetical protein
MGSFLDCKVEPNFTKFEISKEIRNNKELKKDNKLKINKRKLNKKKYKEDNNYINYHEDLNDEEIIINTDEEQSEIREKTKDTSTKDNIKDNKKDLNNKIFISNINANNKRNKKKEDKKKETYNSEIKNDYNCFNSNEENMELDELLNKVFSNNIKTTYNNNNDKILLTESEIDKEYYEQLYSEQSQYNLNANKYINENDQKIIKKLKEIKDKITNKNNPIRKNKLKYNKNFNTVKPKPTSKSMNNKQIRNNIPNYRKHIK